MSFKQYTDKSSLDRKYSRYVLGGTSDLFPDRVGFWEKKSFVKNKIDDISLVITKKFEFRPDLVAFSYYKRTDLEWLILQYNNIIDINEEFIAGNTITIPSPQRVFFTITTQPNPPNVIK